MKTKTSELAKSIAESDYRIQTAIAQLERSERGRRGLRDFKAMFKNGAAGFDSQNFAALLTLTTEAAIGRRDFIDLL
jgi:hypothetical protein